MMSIVKSGIRHVSSFVQGLVVCVLTTLAVFAQRPHTTHERWGARNAAGLCGPSPLVCLNCYTYASLQWQSCIIYSMLIRVCEGVWAD